jgi:hypothetical protein
MPSAEQISESRPSKIEIGFSVDKLLKELDLEVNVDKHSSTAGMPYEITQNENDATHPSEKDSFILKTELEGQNPSTTAQDGWAYMYNNLLRYDQTSGFFVAGKIPIYAAMQGGLVFLVYSSRIFLIPLWTLEPHIPMLCPIYAEGMDL